MILSKNGDGRKKYTNAREFEYFHKSKSQNNGKLLAFIQRMKESQPSDRNLIHLKCPLFVT